MTLYEKLNKLGELNGGCLTITQMNDDWQIGSYGGDAPLSMEQTYPYIKDKNLKEAVNKALERCFELEMDKKWLEERETSCPQVFDDPDEQEMAEDTWRRKGV